MRHPEPTNRTEQTTQTANMSNAMHIAKLVKQFKHIKKVLDKVAKNGSVVERIAPVGVELVITRGDLFELRYKTMLAEITEKLNTYRITQANNTTETNQN